MSRFCSRSGRRSSGRPSWGSRPFFLVLIAEEFAPVGLPHAVRVHDHDGNLHLVGQANGGTERVERGHAAADLIFRKPATAGAGRKNDGAGVAIAVPGERKRDRVGLSLVDLFESVACHSKSLRTERHSTKRRCIATCAFAGSDRIAWRYGVMSVDRTAPCDAWRRTELPALVGATRRLPWSACRAACVWSRACRRGPVPPLPTPSSGGFPAALTRTPSVLSTPARIPRSPARRR